MTEHPQEHFLGYVFVIAGGNAQVADDAEHTALMTRDERGKGSDVSPAGGLDEDVVLRIVFGQKELLFPRTSTAMTE